MGPYYVCCDYDLHLVRSVVNLSIYLRYYSAVGIYFSFRWGPFVHSLEIVQWDSTRRDHPGTLEGYPGRVLSAWYQSSRFLNSLGLYIVVQLIQCFVCLPNLTLEIDYVSFILGNSSSSWWRTEVDVGPIRFRWKVRCTYL